VATLITTLSLGRSGISAVVAIIFAALLATEVTTLTKASVEPELVRSMAQASVAEPRALNPDAEPNAIVSVEPLAGRNGKVIVLHMER
jgi:hypothetical protein